MSAIVHKAEVVSVEKNMITARITLGSACNDCSLKQACEHYKHSENIVVHTKNPQDYMIGQHVEIIMEKKQIAYAALWGYILPLAIVLITMVICYVITGSEEFAAYLSLATLPLYYLFLKIFHKHLQRVLKIKIR